MKMCDCIQGRLPVTVEMIDGWNACLDEIAKRGTLYTRPAQGDPVDALILDDCVEHKHPGYGVGYFGTEVVKLYTHPAPTEVERLRDELKASREIGVSDQRTIQNLVMERDTLRAQLAERDALRAQLAERDALRSFADEIVSAAYEGGSFEGGDIQDMAVKHGLLRIESRAEECGEACACREYGFPAECYRKTGVLSASAEPSKIGNSEYSVAEPSAPVERDERAEFEADWAHRMKVAGHRERANAFYRIQPNDRYRWNDVQDAWEAWQARAALEHKS